MDRRKLHLSPSLVGLLRFAPPDLPARDTQNFNHHAEAYLHLDTWCDLDFEVRVIGDYVNDPVTQADGTLPCKDDFRITLGLGWDF